MVRREYPDNPLVGVGAFIKKNNSVLLVKREYEPGKGKWSLPGGLVNLGEKISDAIKREVEEEVGLKVDVIKIVDVFDSIEYDDKGKVRFHYVIVGFMVKVIEGKVRSSKEASQVKWFKADELKDLEITSTTRKLLEEVNFLRNI
ncbi:MAG: NUDIX hydrolase [Nitrososphaerales archaeon]